jgi:hypothetical protein
LGLKERAAPNKAKTRNGLMTKKVKIFTFFAIAGTLASAFLFYHRVQAASSAQITATVAVGVCGNNIVEHGEDCDGSSLDGQTCLSLGYDGGTLSCNVGCNFDVSECVDLDPGIDTGSVVFSGTAYPLSVVRILKDGQIAATTAADANGHFETTLSDIAVGSYTFSIYAFDNNGERSKTLTYQTDIVKDEIEEISEIIIPPTISLDDENVVQGEKINISGKSAPLSLVTIFVESASGSFSRSVTSNSEGFYSYELDTGSLNADTYSVRSTTTVGGSVSAFSEEVYFEVTALPPSPPPPPSSRIILIDGMDLTTWRCTAQTTKRKPVFVGTTNIPGAVVRIEIRTRKSKRRIITQTRANADGRWTWRTPSRLKRKTYTIQVNLSSGEINFSHSLPFKLVKKIKKSTRRRCRSATYIPAIGFPTAASLVFQNNSPKNMTLKRNDFIDETRANLINASIFVDHFKSEGFSFKADLNGDGKLDLSDFSILMYYWSG